jgi:large subunit ribosomal protein L29
MKSSELKELSLEELERKSGELRAELFNVRIKKATGQLENTAKLRSLRRDIARTETLLCEMRGAMQ